MGGSQRLGLSTAGPLNSAIWASTTQLVEVSTAGALNSRSLWVALNGLGSQRPDHSIQSLGKLSTTGSLHGWSLSSWNPKKALNGRRSQQPDFSTVGASNQSGPIGAQAGPAFAGPAGKLYELAIVFGQEVLAKQRKTEATEASEERK